jgi:hypothetical protein
MNKRARQLFWQQVELLPPIKVNQLLIHLIRCRKCAVLSQLFADFHAPKYATFAITSFRHGGRSAIRLMADIGTMTGAHTPSHPRL